MPSNSAAYIMASKDKPLQVKEAPYPKAGEKDVIIHNKAFSINPVDWKIQDSGFYVKDYPFILGTDVAGEVAEVGSAVKDFKKGDRVLGHCVSLLTADPAGSGFQQYTMIPETLVCPIPSSMTFESATVLPLGISTAAAGLYEKEFLALQHPSLSAKSTGKTVLVWGGASSVGSCAIQLLVHSGYDVLTTASAHNKDYCTKLGASQVFDYNKSDVVDEISKALKGKNCAGIYDAISLEPTQKACVAIAKQADIENKFVVLTLPPSEEASGSGIKVKSVFAVTILHNEVGPAVYKDFLPEAIGQGKFLAKPDPLVIGHGLEKAQAGMDKLKAGVSAGKVVVTL